MLTMVLVFLGAVLALTVWLAVLVAGGRAILALVLGALKRPVEGLDLGAVGDALPRASHRLALLAAPGSAASTRSPCGYGHGAGVWGRSSATPRAQPRPCLRARRRAPCRSDMPRSIAPSVGRSPATR